MATATSIFFLVKKDIESNGGIICIKKICEPEICVEFAL